MSVRYDLDGAVARITVDRPERRNALDGATLTALREALAQAGADPAVRVVTITGAGERAFSAGGDLAPAGAGFLAMHEGRGAFAETLLAVQRLGKPTVARINGDALGGGLGLAMACDLAVAREDARLGCPEIDLGLFPMMIMALLFRHVSRKVGLEMILTGRRLTGAEAAEAGLVNRAVPAAALDETVAELTERLAGKSPAVLRLGLGAFHTMSDMPYEDALRYLHGCLTVNTLTEDAAEGVMAFLQKRQPVWKGR